MVKRASTSIPVHEFIAERWSPRSFDTESVISDEEIIGLIEAARWAPSAMNVQPWRFAVAKRGTQEFETYVGALNPGNAAWAHRASAIIVAATHTMMQPEKRNPWAEYDLGLAVSLLTVQAHATGWHVHQMGGFDRAAIRTALDLPADVEPTVLLAIGSIGEPEQLQGPLYEREVSPRERKPLEEIVIAGLD